MTEVVRLTLVSHAMTDAMAAGRFPADEPLNAVGRRHAEAAARLAISTGTRQSPARRNVPGRPPVAGLERRVIEPRLADLDCGSWRGQPRRGRLDRSRAMADRSLPRRRTAASRLSTSSTGWLAGWTSLTDNALRTVVVTHPAVIRAAILIALNVPPNSFWRIDVAPASCIVMHFRENSWTRVRL